jgi:hypothetical protein
MEEIGRGRGWFREHRGGRTGERSVCLARVDGWSAVAGRTARGLEDDRARTQSSEVGVVAQLDARWRGRWRGANGVKGVLWVYGDVAGDDVHDGCFVEERAGRE